MHNAFPKGLSCGVPVTRPSLITKILDPLRPYCVYCTTIDSDKKDIESDYTQRREMSNRECRDVPSETNLSESNQNMESPFLFSTLKSLS